MNPDYQYQPQPQPQPSQVPPTPGQFQTPNSMPQPGYAQIPPVNVPPIAPKRSKKWIILTFVFIFTTLLALGLAGWALINYLDQKNNVDSKVSSAVAIAVKEQADKDAAAFLETEKQPNRQFVGPEDYGRLSLEYPKTWSVHVAKDASNGGTFEAYFNPGDVPPISNTQQYALHVTIEEKDYDRVVESYKSLVSRGDLTSSSVKIDDQNGTRLDGAFTKDIKGSAVIIKIRDKTVTVRTDAETFKNDFDALIQTITFNK